MLYIDAFNHILPKKYQAVLEQKVPNRDMSSNLSRARHLLRPVRAGPQSGSRQSAGPT